MTKVTYRRIYLWLTDTEVESMNIMTGGIAAGKQHGPAAVAEISYLDTEA